MGTDPGCRPGGRADAHRGGGFPGRAAVDHAVGPRRSAELRRDDPARCDGRAAHPAWPARAVRAPARRRPVICISSCASRRIRGTASRVVTCSSSCRWRRGRLRSAPPSPSTRPAAKPSCACPAGRRAGGDCGSRVAACPTRAARPATSTPRPASWCRQRRVTTSAGCSRSWRARRRSIPRRRR